jgi:hypothetical protein
VAAVPQGLVAVGIGGIWVSDDGRAWELAPVSAEVPFWGTDVIIWKDQVFAVGIGDSNPAILMRPNAGRSTLGFPIPWGGLPVPSLSTGAPLAGGG